MPIIDDAMQIGRPVADQHGALDRRGDLAVLDQIGLGALEHELARGDVDLAAAEIHRVEAVLHRGDDFLRVVRAGEHVGVGHARHRHVGIAFAPAVAGRLHAHQPRVLPVLHVADQDAVLDQHGAVGRRAFVVDGERAAALLHGAVVDHGDALGGDALAHQPGEGGGLLAVEIAFQPVADGFVQHHARPAGPQHDVHLAGRRGHRVEIDQRLAHGFVDRALPGMRLDEALIAFAPADAVAAGFLAVAVADDDRDVEPHQRTDVAIGLAVARAGFPPPARWRRRWPMTWRTRGSLARA